MAQLVFLVGKSGMGKSTSLRNLNPDETVIINTDQKALPFKQFNLKYNEDKKNYKKTSDAVEVYKVLNKVNSMENVKTVVIDTWSRIMTDAIMSQSFRAEKGFDKWSKMAANQYDLINYINDGMRDDIIVYLMAHPETHFDENGFSTERIGVQGKMLERFVPESFSTIVLYAEIIKQPGQANKHVFRTVSSGSDTCKTPLEMFETDSVENDLLLVNQKIREYYSI
ncbi:MAG: Cellulophaga phage phi14:2 [Bacteroidota bacterium]|jgi:energy-coupling factor transporter ATP-binding protein EcfA2